MQFSLTCLRSMCDSIQKDTYLILKLLSYSTNFPIFWAHCANVLLLNRTFLVALLKVISEKNVSLCMYWALCRTIFGCTLITLPNFPCLMTINSFLFGFSLIALWSSNNINNNQLHEKHKCTKLAIYNPHGKRFLEFT